MHILIAVGGSEHSQIALHQAVQLVRRLPFSATILTVVKEWADAPKAASILQEAEHFLRPAVPELHTKTRAGSASEQIIDEAKSGAYDLLIIGERPHHPLLTRLLGPTALRVVGQRPCPVLIAKEQPYPLAQILICDSVYADPNVLVRFSKSLPHLLAQATHVTLLHVMSQIAAAPGIQGHQLRADVDELIQIHAPEGETLSQDVDLLQQNDVLVEPIVRHGLVVEEILAEATDGRYDLIVIGAHPQDGWAHFLLEDVTAQIVIQANRPVLVIP